MDYEGECEKVNSPCLLWRTGVEFGTNVGRSPPLQWLSPDSLTSMVGSKVADWTNLAQVAGLFQGCLLPGEGRYERENREGALTCCDVKAVFICVNTDGA